MATALQTDRFEQRFEIGMLARQVVFSYRGLLGWTSPANYVMWKIVEPSIQILFFVLMGRYAGADTTYLVIGNSVRLVATSGLWGVVSVILNERRARTLPSVIASSTPGAQTFYARALAQVFDGLVTVAFGFAIGALLFGLDFSRVDWGWFILSLLAIAYAVSGFGLAVSSTLLIGTEANLVANLAFNLLLLFCGVNFPIQSLPLPMQSLASVLPLTHGLEAIRNVFGGQTNGVPMLLVWELLAGTGYAVAGYLLFAIAERIARVQGTLDLV